MIFCKLWICGILTVIGIYDARRLIIPDFCVLLMLPAAFFSSIPWTDRLTAAAAIWALFLLTALAAALLKSSVPLGMGDFKLFSAIALISGAPGLITSVAVSTLSCGVYAALLLILKKAQKKDQIAFGPFIALAYSFYLASTSAI